MTLPTPPDLVHLKFEIKKPSRFTFYVSQIFQNLILGSFPFFINLKFIYRSVRMRPEILIQAVTESKLARKRAVTAAKLEAKKAVESEKLMVRRAITPPDFGSLNDNSMLKLADFVPVCFALIFWIFLLK